VKAVMNRRTPNAGASLRRVRAKAAQGKQAEQWDAQKNGGSAGVGNPNDWHHLCGAFNFDII
jgi:hypothetical protein